MVCTALSHLEAGDLYGYYNSFPADSSKVSFQILKFFYFLFLLFKFPFYSKNVEVMPCPATSVQYLEEGTPFQFTALYGLAVGLPPVSLSLLLSGPKNPQSPEPQGRNSIILCGA